MSKPYVTALSCYTSKSLWHSQEGSFQLLKQKKYIAIFFYKQLQKVALVISPQPWQWCHFLTWLESSLSLSPVPATACLENQLPSCNLSLQLVPVQCY